MLALLDQQPEPGNSLPAPPLPLLAPPEPRNRLPAPRLPLLAHHYRARPAKKRRRLVVVEELVDWQHEEGWIQDAVAQINAKTVAQVDDLWHQLNILTPRGEAEPDRNPAEHFWFDKLKTFWTTAALIVHITDPPVLRCHCFMSAAKGHCVHEYVIAELVGKPPLFGHIWPLARVGAAALRNRRNE